MSDRKDERAVKVFCWFVIVGAILNGCHGASSEEEMGRAILSAIGGAFFGAIGGAVFGFILWEPIRDLFSPD